MTTNKAQKRAIRSRMAKTGERYTTARHYELNLHRATASTAETQAAGDASMPVPGLELNPPTPTAEPGLPPRVAEPGISDAAIQRGSGRTWDEWFAILDAWQATTRGHTAIARYIAEEHGVDGWWAQNVTVGYERARGLRAVNQRSDGFSTNASRTFAVSVERLFAAIVEHPGELLIVRSARKPRSARFDVPENGTRVSATFIARSAEKSTVQLQQLSLPDREAVETWRARLHAYLDQVAETLT